MTERIVQATQSACACRESERDEGYPELEKFIAARVAQAKGPLFCTNAKNLFGIYLGWLHDQRRQHYKCRACERFIERYGHLGTIDEAGRLHSLFWEAVRAPEFFRCSFRAMRQEVEESRVTGVFLSSDEAWGQPVTGSWTHLSGTNPQVYKDPLKTAEQAMAEKREEYLMLRRGLADYPVAAVHQAVRILDADALDRSEKTLGVARWLLELHEVIARNPMHKENLIWRAAAMAPPGWCHLRSTMIHTLLDDIVQGLPFEMISRRWAQKMHPLQYQRPQAPPSDGAIQQAEKIVEKLQAASALNRRFATLSDVVPLWLPQEAKAAPEKRNGVFGHLKQKPEQVQPVELPQQPITWEKFRREVLPRALGLEVKLGDWVGPFYGLVTAADPAAPPILQWDGLESWPRNPVSWYFYHALTTPLQWGLMPGWHRVACVFLKPSLWQEPERFKHHGRGAFFVVPGCKDQRRLGAKANPGGGFFVESLRAEYHGVRSVMESYMRTAVIQGGEHGDANGVAFDGQPKETLLVRVRTESGLESYLLDRWD